MQQRSRAKRTNLRVSAAEAEPVASSVGGSQETYGNGVSSAALRGDDLGGLGPVVRHTIARSVAGVSDALPPLRDQGSGTPLPDAVRGRMEAAFGHDFGHVRIHVGSVAAGDAEALQAHAFAVGADIYFGSGEWAPGSALGSCSRRRPICSEFSTTAIELADIPAAASHGCTRPSAASGIAAKL